MEKVNSYQLFAFHSKHIILTMHREENREIMERAHCHQQMEVMLVVSGRGAIKTSNDNNIDVEAGDILVFDSMQPHQLFYIDETEPFDTLSVEFDIRGFVTEEYKVFDTEDLDRFFIKLHNAECIISKETKSASKIKNLLCLMEEEFENDNKGSNHVIRAQMLVLYAVLLQYFDEVYDTKSLKKSNQSAAVEKTMIYINQNLNENLTLDTLAKIANMNKTYYSTTFKKVAGVGVWEYILNMRIELAISYLVMNKETYNISEIAQLCGFNNATNFNKTFKKVTGKTPSEYKKTKYNLCFSE